MKSLVEKQKTTCTDQTTNPAPSAKPLSDYIRCDETGREYIVITKVSEIDGQQGFEQYRRYLEPLNDADAHRIFFPFHCVQA